MARTPPEDDPRVTDLNRYRKAKAAEAKRPPPKPKRPKESLLGSNPKAGVILAIAAIVLIALYVVPMFLK
ncbi:MAG: hypothetical protein AB1942_10225 [Pseudomonadota bacterium]